MAESAGALAVREQRALSADFGAHLSGPQLKFIANTDFIPAGLRGNLPAIGACVATGRALGLPDMTALRSIHVIDGKATFSSELMVMLARKAGHSITGTVTAEKAVVTGKRGDNGDEMTTEFTIEMATRIGLTKKQNWQKYPESMLWARAVSQLCRMLFADCFAGASYTPEELGAGDVTADELLDEPPGAAGDAVAPEEPEAAEVLAVSDEEIAEASTEPPGPQTQEQRDRLLELYPRVVDARPDVDWGGELTKKIKKDYGAEKYGDLNEAQMEELLAWLEEQIG